MCKPDDIVFVCWLLAKSEEIDKAKEIIRKMTFNYESDTFENPGKIHSESTPLIGLIIAGLHGPTFSFLPSHDVPYQPLLSLRYVACFSQLQTGLEWIKWFEQYQGLHNTMSYSFIRMAWSQAGSNWFRTGFTALNCIWNYIETAWE